MSDDEVTKLLGDKLDYKRTYFNHIISDLEEGGLNVITLCTDEDGDPELECDYVDDYIENDCG